MTAFTAFAKALTIKFDSLKTILSSWQHHLKDNSAKIIAKVLKSNTTFQELSPFLDNHIGLDGISAVSKALKINSTLQEVLTLFGKPRGVAGEMAIANALTSNSTLLELWLVENRVGSC